MKEKEKIEFEEIEEALETKEETEEIEPEEELETEEIEKHEKKYPHKYVLVLSEKENEIIKELEQRFEADSIKELLLKLNEELETTKEYPYVSIVHFTTEEKVFLKKVQKQYEAEDFRELLLKLSRLAQERKCPECGLNLSYVGLCLNCAKAYDYSDELEEETEEAEE